MTTHRFNTGTAAAGPINVRSGVLEYGAGVGRAGTVTVIARLDQRPDPFRQHFATV